MLPLIAALPREDPWQREVRWLEERLALACGYDQSHLTRESNNALVVRLENYALLTAENAAAAVHRGLRGPGYPGSPRWCSGGPAEAPGGAGWRWKPLHRKLPGHRRCAEK